jgi:hypothetical protein
MPVIPLASQLDPDPTENAPTLKDLTTLIIDPRKITPLR